MTTVTTAPELDTPAPPEPIVRYFEYLEDPTSLLDVDAIASAEQTLAAGNLSKSEELRTRLHLLKLLDADDSVLIDEFLAAAPGYFETCGVNPDDGKSVLLELGVPEMVVNRLQIRRRARAGKVTVDDVTAWIRARRTGFTKPEAIDATGASQGTVNKAVKAALTDQLIADRGGNPKRYERC